MEVQMMLPEAPLTEEELKANIVRRLRRDKTQWEQCGILLRQHPIDLEVEL